MQNENPPDALMFLSGQCPHCPAVLQGLGELVKKGELRRMEIVNIEREPERARELGVRSVPWVRLGPFELIGLHSPAELRRWAMKAGSIEGISEWCAELLTQGELARVLSKVHESPVYLDALLLLLGDEQTSINVRIGIGAVIEDLAGSAALIERVERLAEISRHANPAVRADAAHFLSFAGGAAREYLEPLLGDEDANVKTIAAESLESIDHSHSTR